MRYSQHGLMLHCHQSCPTLPSISESIFHPCILPSVYLHQSFYVCNFNHFSIICECMCTFKHLSFSLFHFSTCLSFLLCLSFPTAGSTVNSGMGAMGSLGSLGTLQGLAGATVGLNNINALAGSVNSEYYRPLASPSQSIQHHLIPAAQCS